MPAEAPPTRPRRGLVLVAMSLLAAPAALGVLAIAAPPSASPGPLTPSTTAPPASPTVDQLEPGGDDLPPTLRRRCPPGRHFGGNCRHRH